MGSERSEKENNGFRAWSWQGRRPSRFVNKTDESVSGAGRRRTRSQLQALARPRCGGAPASADRQNLGRAMVYRRATVRLWPGEKFQNRMLRPPYTVLLPPVSPVT